MNSPIRLRLVVRRSDVPGQPFGARFRSAFRQRIEEADEFYAARLPQYDEQSHEQRHVARQAYAGLLWSKQFYHYVVRDWLDGDPESAAAAQPARRGRNRDWPHLFNRDVISMPDKWEYPWFAAWDLAFHMIAMAQIDPEFAKEQLHPASCANGTCTPTARFRPTNGTFAT